MARARTAARKRRAGYAIQAYVPQGGRQLLGENYWLPMRGECRDADFIELATPSAIWIRKPLPNVSESIRTGPIFFIMAPAGNAVIERANRAIARELMLTEAQQAEFWERGVIVLESAYSEQDLEPLRAQHQRWIEESREHAALW